MDLLTIDILKILDTNALPVILCLGSDRVLGDCVGPMVGEMLTRKYSVPTYVYGTLTNNITTNNIKSTIEFIKSNHKDRSVLVVDCGVGGIDKIGQIRVCKGAVRCACFNEMIGDRQIIAYTSHLGATEKCFLRTTRIQTVTYMATKIAKSINDAINIVSNINACPLHSSTKNIVF